MNVTSALTELSNKNNFSCIIMKSNEKVRHNGSSSSRKAKENISQQYGLPVSKFGERLEQIEADAYALKRSMLDSAKGGIDNTTVHQYSTADSLLS